MSVKAWHVWETVASLVCGVQGGVEWAPDYEKGLIQHENELEYYFQMQIQDSSQNQIHINEF